MRIATELLMDKYKDNLFAVAFNVCKSSADADDVVQETFIQYHNSDKEFENEQHIKAWLIRVAVNKSVNVTRSLWRRQTVPLEEYMEALSFETPEAESLFEEVMKLPDKYRVVIHLFYYEDYSVREIAGIVKATEGSVKTRLNRGRKLLRKALKEEWSNDEQ